MSKFINKDLYGRRTMFTTTQELFSDITRHGKKHKDATIFSDDYSVPKDMIYVIGFKCSCAKRWGITLGHFKHSLRNA